MALGCHNHNDVYRRLPPAFETFGTFKQATSVHVYLLPYRTT
jgi:hypothetical protein